MLQTASQVVWLLCVLTTRLLFWASWLLSWKLSWDTACSVKRVKQAGSSDEMLSLGTPLTVNPTNSLWNESYPTLSISYISLHLWVCCFATLVCNETQSLLVGLMSGISVYLYFFLHRHQLSCGSNFGISNGAPYMTPTPCFHHLYYPAAELARLMLAPLARLRLGAP